MKRFFKPVEKEGSSKKPTIHSLKNDEEETAQTTPTTHTVKKDPTKFLTWNANSFLLRVKNNWPEFTKFLQEFDPDVIAIQEVRLPAAGSKGNPKNPRELKDDTSASREEKQILMRAISNSPLREYNVWWSLSDTKYAGTALFVKKCFNPKVSFSLNQTASKHEPDGRVILAEFETFRLLNTYVPNNGWKDEETSFQRRRKWDKRMLDFVLQTLDKPLIWCGDLNVSHEEIDVSHAEFFSSAKLNGYIPPNKEDCGQPGFTLSERKRFGGILKQGNLLDAYRLLHKDKDMECGFSWSGNPVGKYRGKRMRIDYFIVSEKLKDRIVACEMHGQGIELQGLYGVPKDAALAFEEVIRSQAYGGEINPISTVAALGKKTTVMSPDAILNAGIPCCRLVQKAGEFVVTFPRAYHSGFSHGFNCAEASNIATPEWLRFAKQAAIRRASINCPPILSHIQLLYSQALSLSSRVPRRIASVPRSSRLKERKIGEGERLVKELFVQDVMHNSDLLDSLGKGSPIVLLPRDFADISMHTKTHIGSPLSCVTCGSLCFACVAILQPGEVAAYNYSPGRVDNSSLSLLALNYGDSSDSEDDLVHAPTTVAVQNRTIHFVSYSDKDSSRLHIFCLEHAIEVEQKLRALGGVHMLILCHPDYQKLQDQAKIMAKELGSNHHCSNITFTKATKEHEEIVRTAVNLEKSIHGSDDWTVRLGVNHFHNINVSRSSLYGRQMTYNSDKHRVFGHTSSEIALKQGTTDSTPTSRDGSLKAQAEDNAPKNRYMFQYKRRYKNKLKEKEIKKETLQLINNDARDVEIRSEGGWSSRLRKRTIKQVTEKCAEVVAESKRHKCSKRAESTSAPTKMNKKVEDDETEHACKVEGCVITFNSEQELMLHEQNVCPVKECGKSFFSHKYLLQHQRVHRDDRPFKCPWKDCNMTFKWAWARTEHIRVHTGVRPYTCTETGCGLTFRFVSDFSRHKRKTGHLRITEHSKKKGSKET